MLLLLFTIWLLLFVMLLILCCILLSELELKLNTGDDVMLTPVLRGTVGPADVPIAATVTGVTVVVDWVVKCSSMVVLAKVST